jgi:hypothetical protein
MTQEEPITKPKKKLTTAEAKDMALAKKIKPKLRKYVIEQQREKAKKAVEEQKEQAAVLDKDYLIKRASQLACIAYFDKQVWREHPPYLEAQWLKKGASTPELIQEMNTDIAGFATYLLYEYNNYNRLRITTVRGYPNPLLEENLPWFWAKMNADMAILIKADMGNIKRGNNSVVVVNNVTDEQLDIIKGKR